MSALPTPDYSRNMRLIGHSDQGGRPDGVQLMVHRGFAYIGHMVSQGFSIVDVRDPKNPRPAGYVPGGCRGRTMRRVRPRRGRRASVTPCTTPLLPGIPPTAAGATAV